MSVTLEDTASVTSPWKFMGFALVIVDNLKGDEEITIWMPELLPYEKGKVLDIREEQTQTLLDFQGKPKRVSIERKAITKAKWRCSVDGRQSPPNVTNGETVEIYLYGKDQQFYWVSNGREPEIRRLEHVVHAYSNLKSGRNAFDKTSSYGNTFSTREKYVNIWTSMSDGEAFAYQLYMDTADNNAALHDNTGNIVKIDSTNKEVHIRNANGMYIQVIGDRVNIKAPEVYIDGTLRVNKIVADEINANITRSSVSSGSGGVVNLSNLPFAPFLSVGDKNTGT